MKFRSLKKLALASLLASMCVVPTKSEAILASTKSLGMAATAIAYPLDSLAVAYNPAGAIDVEDRVDFGLGWLHNTAHSKLTGNFAPLAGVNGKSKLMRTRDFYPVEFGINKHFCPCICSKQIHFAAGVILYNRNFQKTTFGKVAPLFGTSKQGLEYFNETISPYIAFKIWNCLSFGISLNWQIERIKVNGLQNFANQLRSLYPDNVTNKGYNYSNGLGFTLGLKWDPASWLSLGATYQPKTNMSRLKKYKGFLAQKGKLDVPQKLGAGIAFKVNCGLAIAFDVEHIRWKKIKALSNKLLTAEGDLNLLGETNGPGFGFRNQLYYRVGLDWRVNECFSLRTGFRTVRAPFKGNQNAVNGLTADCVEKVWTFGGTYDYDCHNEFSGYFGYGFQHSINGKDCIPPAFGFGSVKLTEQKFVVGLGWGYKF